VGLHLVRLLDDGSTGFGPTHEERLSAFFEQIVGILAERPKLAAAMLRTMASGVPALAERVARYRDEMTQTLLHVMRDGGPSGVELPAESEQLVAEVLQDVLFASLVGWTGGLHGADDVLKHLKDATHMLLRGARVS
jgi:hypothetical protein